MRNLSLTARTVCVVVAALLAGVSAPAGVRAQTPAGWQRTDVRPMTQPALAGGLFVMYARAPGGLEIIAVDPATGRTAWSQPASPSATTQGEAPIVAIAGTDAIFMSRASGTDARVSGADLRTGAIVWQSSPASFTTWPAVCGDDATAICVSAESASGVRGGELRFDAATGRPLASASLAGDDVREVGAELLDPGDRDPDHLAAVRGASIAWNRPTDRVFSHPVTSDFGWNFGRYADIGLYVGWLGLDAPVRGGRFVTRLADNETVGLRIADGRTVWRSRGLYVCYTLPCPGVDETGGLAAAVPNLPGASLGVRLVERGTARTSFVTGVSSLSRDADVTLEGFTPATGRTRWRFDAGRDAPLIEATSLPPRTGITRIVVPDRQRRLRQLDLATGAARPIGAAAPAWCRRLTTFRAATTDLVGDPTTDDFAGQEALVPCSAGSRRRVPTPANVPAFVARIGASAAGLVAWGDTTGLFARPVAP